MIEPPYLSYSRYLRRRHGCTVYRVSVDAGFSCPNRGNGRSSGGCSYCAPEGARAPYLNRADVLLPAGCGGHVVARLGEVRRSATRQVLDAEDYGAFSRPRGPVDVPVTRIRSA